jgi:hypothetical protein
MSSSSELVYIPQRYARGMIKSVTLSSKHEAIADSTEARPDVGGTAFTYEQRC